MKYITLDGTILESSSDKSVVYKQPVKDYNDGTYISYETGYYNDITQQIKVVREVTNNIMTITITEQSQNEIDSYLEQIEQEQIKNNVQI